jgi:hypothetical protein
MIPFRRAMSRSIAPPAGDASRSVESELDRVVDGRRGRAVFLKFFEFHGGSLVGLREHNMTHRTNGSVRVTNVNFAA